jgi:hypothetical protein
VRSPRPTDADQIRDTERHAYAVYDRAERARTHLDEARYAQLRPYGQAAHTRDPGGRLAAVTDELASVQRDLRTATAQVDVLQREPTVRALPQAGLDQERERWAADRVARHQAASREDKEHRQRRQETPRTEPPPPSRSTPDHRRGVGR